MSPFGFCSPDGPDPSEDNDRPEDPMLDCVIDNLWEEHKDKQELETTNQDTK